MSAGIAVRTKSLEVIQDLVHLTQSFFNPYET